MKISRRIDKCFNYDLFKWMYAFDKESEVKMFKNWKNR